MADKSIEQLAAAENVYATDLFVLQQSGTAKKLTGQVLENWLVSFADGHGGIQSIQKVSTSGLVDTYRTTLADTTTFDFVVTNGRSVNSISKTSTSGLMDTYTIEYNDGTTGDFTVKNGEKGDKGDNAYVWIKYASQEPNDESHSIGDIPDNWIGIYAGNVSTAPSDWEQYKWFKVKGEKGDTGDPATLLIKSVTYQVGDSGSITPSGTWSSSVPVVPQGKYLWTKTELRFNSGDPVVSYSVTRMGLDGSGSVASVNNISPNETGNVSLTASDVGALSSTGGDMTGEIRMNGQPVSGLNPPTEDTQVANKGYVDSSVRKAAPRNLLDNTDFSNPVNQHGYANGTVGSGNYSIDRWILQYDTYLHLNTGFIGITGAWDIAQKLGCSLQAGKTYTFTVDAMATDATGYAYLKFGSDSKVFPNLIGGIWHHLIIHFTADKDYAPGESYVSLGINGHPSEITGTYFKNPAVYEGEYTVETLPEYQPKGYAAELLECQRYYNHLFLNEYLYQISFDSFEVFNISISFPEMRIVPTATLDGVNIGGTEDRTKKSLRLYSTQKNSKVNSITLSADL